MGGAMCHCDKPHEESVKVISIPDPTSCYTNIYSATEDPRCVLNQQLLAASRENDIGALKLAIAEGAYLETRRPFLMRPKPPNAWEQDPFGNSKKRGPKEGMTPLMYASQNGSVAAVRLLLQARANVAANDEDGMRPLHFAAQSASQEVCCLLVQRGANVSVTDDEGKKPKDFLPSDELYGSNALQWQELFGSTFSPVAGADSKVTGLGSLTAVSSELNPQGPSYLPPAPFSLDKHDALTVS
mmetsp:Transcript_12388/g.15414  ORF Transcript_12388/g.15414 Transcript_12388/m.15414 type:complete len:242 (+) Transcript_12388:126-851(+)